MSEWKTYMLGDICKTNSSSYSNKDKWDFVNYLDTGNITGNDIDAIQYIDLKSEKLPSRAKRKVKFNSIVYSTVRPNQLHYGIIKNQPENFLVSTGFTVIDVDEDIADADFIYYWLTQSALTEKLHSIAEQSVSAYPSIKSSDIEGLEIELPPLNEQKRIAEILASLDNKRKNNAAINRNLSEQLRIVFEDMFLTNAEDNWPIKKLGDFLELERGLSYKGKFLAENDGIPMLNLGNILPNSVFRPEKLKFYTGDFKPRHVVMPGDIIVANTDLTQAREVLGSAIRVPDLGYETVICSHHISIVKNSRISNNFILGLLNMPAYRTRVAGFATGTTVLALPNDTILNCEFQCPPEAFIKNYDDIAEPIYGQMEEIRRENDQLSVLRDNLLPRLMSGELDVTELDV